MTEVNDLSVTVAQIDTPPQVEQMRQPARPAGRIRTYWARWLQSLSFQGETRVDWDFHSLAYRVNNTQSETGENRIAYNAPSLCFKQFQQSRFALLLESLVL